MQESLTFDDVLISPQFSTIRSRKDVSLTQEFCGSVLSIPIISSNMDTVTESEMSKAMLNYGGQACLHRFCSIEDNIKMFNASKVGNSQPIVSLGVGNKELERAKALYDFGATTFLIDVAHGAAIHVCETYDKLREIVKYNASIIVGNFDNATSIYAFNQHIKSKFEPDAFKVGIGPGSACTTRIVTGCGGGSITALQSCSTTGFPIIADGGCRNSGDIAKALAAGASVVMLGRMLAGTDESPSKPVYGPSASTGSYSTADMVLTHKTYRGSASSESYKVQNKEAEHRAPEGESMLVPYVGSVKSVLQNIEGGLRSSLSYVGAKDLTEFRKKALFVRTTSNTAKESKAHGKE